MIVGLSCTKLAWLQSVNIDSTISIVCAGDLDMFGFGLDHSIPSSAALVMQYIQSWGGSGLVHKTNMLVHLADQTNWFNFTVQIYSCHQ